ncbi:uncharacterized protein V6R79_024510 [Siganus canaliculatus]
MRLSRTPDLSLTARPETTCWKRSFSRKAAVSQREKLQQPAAACSLAAAASANADRPRGPTVVPWSTTSRVV